MVEIKDSVMVILRKPRVLKVSKAKVVSKKARAKMPKVHQIKVKPTEVVEVRVPPGTHPVILQKSRDTIEIVPVPKAKKQGWMEYLFGDLAK